MDVESDMLNGIMEVLLPFALLLTGTRVRICANNEQRRKRETWTPSFGLPER